MVKVKMLKNVGPHTAGEVVEVSHEEAEHLCKVTSVRDGEHAVPHVRAKRLEDHEADLDALKNSGDLDALEAKQLGVKNITEPPFDPAWEDRKKLIEADNERFLAEQKAKDEGHAVIVPGKTDEAKLHPDPDAAEREHVDTKVTGEDDAAALEVEPRAKWKKKGRA